MGKPFKWLFEVYQSISQEPTIAASLDYLSTAADIIAHFVKSSIATPQLVHGIIAPYRALFDKYPVDNVGKLVLGSDNDAWDWGWEDGFVVAENVEYKRFPERRK